MSVSFRGMTFYDRATDEGVSGNLTWGWNKSRGRRVYDVDMTLGFSEQTFAKALLGYAEVKGESTTKWVSRWVPHSLGFTNPDGKPFLYAVNLEQQGLAPLSQDFTGTSFAKPNYRMMRCQVDYETLPFKILEDAEVTTRNGGNPDESGWERYVTKIVRPSGQFFTVNSGPDGSGYFWAATGGVVRIGVSKLLSFCNLQVTWHQVPEKAVPSVFVNPNLTSYSAIENCIGKVNHETFNSYLKGTLLLLGAELKPSISPFGVRVYDIVYMFKFFAPTATTGHQYLFKPSAADWAEVTTEEGVSNLATQANGKSIYDWAKTSGSTFKDLFRPPA